jgi:hypothetical protein
MEATRYVAEHSRANIMVVEDEEQYAKVGFLTLLQCCGSGFIESWFRIRIQNFDDQKLKKKIQLKKKFIFSCNLLIPGPP